MENPRIFKQVAIGESTHCALLWLQYSLSKDGKKPTMAELIAQAVELLEAKIEASKHE